VRRRLNAEERALWAKVVATVRPLEVGVATPPVEEEPPVLQAAPTPTSPRTSPKVPAGRSKAPGTTLDSSWDRRLSRGTLQPDVTVDLHGHKLDSAYSLLDLRLDQAIAGSARLVLLVTGKPPSDDRRPAARGEIRAAVGDWLAASRHAGDIAAVRNAHPRHGGQGALYIVLRRKRERNG
jgi:DNA-nicking Smr family endonuclease